MGQRPCRRCFIPYNNVPEYHPAVIKAYIAAYIPMKAYSMHIKKLGCSYELLKTYLWINLYQKEGSGGIRKIYVHGLPTSLILIIITYLIINLYKFDPKISQQLVVNKV